MSASIAKVETARAAAYVSQLCKHFAHKTPVTLEPGHGRISFEAGTCEADAEGDVLTLRVTTADAEALARLQDVVERHLLRFAYKEDLKLDWQAAA